MKAKLKILDLRCRRCGHRWRPRIPDVAICPRCKSARWNEAKKVKGEEAQ